MFSKQLKMYRKMRGFTQEELAKAVGIAKSTISMYESGKREPDFETMETIADVLNVSLGLLMDSRASSSPRLFVPVINALRTGDLPDVQNGIIGYEAPPEGVGDAGDLFAMRAGDESMEPRILGGDMLIIRRQPEVESGQLALIMLREKEVLIRKLVKHESSIALFAFNPTYEPLFFTEEQILSLPVTVIGRLIEARSRF